MFKSLIGVNFSVGGSFYSIPRKSYICYDNRPSTLPVT
nr:MAG TPA: hypothetical protein [Bacteriophage sp.]